MAKASDQIKADLRRARGVEAITPDRLLSSGSTVLNLACTGLVEGAFLKGHYYLYCGDSDSGKTFVGLACLAEAANNRSFDGYDLVYDAPEGGALMDIRRFYGRRLAERLQPPAADKDGRAEHSRTVQQFYEHLDARFKRGRPFVWLLDSQDCMSSEEEIKHADKRARRADDGEGKGSYGDGKARYHSQHLRRVLGPLADSGSILVIINQARQSFDPFNPDAYSGGTALRFYATLQLWSKNGGKIKRQIRGKDRQLGILAKIRVKKNRITGRDRSVVVPIYHSAGIDEVGSMVDYLVSERRWVESGGVVTVSGLGPEFDVRREALVAKIEEDDLEDDVRELVRQTWDGVEAACVVKRKPRYE